MKKIFLTAISIVSISAFAQTKKDAEFTKKITYKIEVSENDLQGYDQSEYDKVTYDHYLSANGKESLLSFYYNDQSLYSYSGESNFYIKNNQMIPFTINGISKTINYSAPSAFKIVSNQQTVAKLDKKGTFNGSSCQYYAVLSDPENKESYDFCFCIDENNKIDNASSVFPDARIKGLILSVEPNADSYKLVYKSVENTDLTLDLDTNKMLADIEEYQNTSVEDYAVEAADAVTEAAYDYADSNNMYQDPLYTYGYDGAGFDNYKLYNYISPVYSVTSSSLYDTKEYNSGGTFTRNQVLKLYKDLSKSMVKSLSSTKMITKDEKKQLTDFFNTNIKAAGSFKPDVAQETVTGDWNATDFATADTAAIATDYDYSYYAKYEPAYNNISVDEVSLAYDILEAESLKENAPDYCEGLKNKIPEFQNTELQKHVYNLTGQICDLYLYNNGGYVDYTGTINSMRKSYLEIEKLRDSLSKKDQKLLLEFLKSLD